MIRSKQLIPNAVTAANMFCGFYSILCAMKGDIATAAWWIIAAGIFDLFDGRIARLLGATSEFGEYFDTLSDLLSFGVAPAVLLYQASSSGPFGNWEIPFFYLLCVAFRLARFSIKSAAPAKGYFQGLSSPVSAATSATLVLFLQNVEWEEKTQLSVLAVGAILLAILMVSHLKFPTFKEMNWRSPTGCLCLGIVAVAFAFCLTHPSVYLFPTLGAFIGGVLVWNVLKALKPQSPL